MRSTWLGLGSAVLGLVVVAGCSDGSGSAAAPESTGAATTQAAPASSGPASAPGLDAATKAACTEISADIEAAMDKVADAEKIGPPAGHSAVSAQYSAGAAGLYARAFTGNSTVDEAVKQVAVAMSDLADKYVSAPKKAPGKSALETAVKQLETVCAAE